MSGMSGMFSHSQVCWFEDLNRCYMKYDVSLYEFKTNDLGKVDFTIRISKDPIIEFMGKEYNVSLLPDRGHHLKEIKEKLIEFLEENGNIRVAIYSDDSDNSDDSNSILLSTYNEEEKKSNYMYDDMFWALYYTIRFPKLDYDGYYILSGMSGDFDTFREKYDMDISVFPFE